jgi:hypothetical protein
MVSRESLKRAWKLGVAQSPTIALIRRWALRGKLLRMQTSDRYGFLFVFLIMLLSGLYSVFNPKAVKAENADVTGFPKTGFSLMPVWGWRFMGIVLIAISGFFLYMFLTH